MHAGKRRQIPSATSWLDGVSRIVFVGGGLRPSILCLSCIGIHFQGIVRMLQAGENLGKLRNCSGNWDLGETAKLQ